MSPPKIGMKLDLSPRHKNSGRPPEKDAPKFLEWARKTHGCLFRADGNCAGRIEAMHLDFAGGKGMGSKVADRFTVIACSYHHDRQHKRGWATFLREFGVTKEALLEAADKMWRAWPGRLKWEASR